MKNRKPDKHKQCWLTIKRAYKIIAVDIARKHGEPSQILAENIAQCTNAEYLNLNRKGKINYKDSLKTFEIYLGQRYTFESDMTSRQIFAELMKLLFNTKKKFEV